MRTKILDILLVILLVCSVFMLTACGVDGEQGPRGEKGEQGEPGKDGADGTDGKDGVDGKTPYIQEGYWYIDGVNTGVKAEGTDGTNGTDGKNGVDGTNGKDGADGEDGIGIEKVEINTDGNIVITFTDGTTQTVEMPKDQHEHTFGEWRNHNTLSSCEDQLYYRICSGCSDIEWRAGSYEDHDFDTVTTSPTCQVGGYDTKTCKKCGVVEICNETPIVDHDYKEDYSTNNSFHWNECKNCDATAGKNEHMLGDDGSCTICAVQIGDTEGIIYEISADGTYAEVLGYNGMARNIKIANTYMGLPVNVIYDNAFYDNNSIISVIIPDSVTSIGMRAFYSCSSLTSVIIGNNVVYIGSSAFEYCYNLTNIVIPDSVTDIDSHAFNSCKELITEYEYGKYVKSGDNPYAILVDITAENLSTFTIHKDTKIIAWGAFMNCSRLLSVIIPDSVTSIGEAAFDFCNNLSDVYYTGTEEDWTKIEINDQYYGKNYLLYATIHYNYVPEE